MTRFHALLGLSLLLAFTAAPAQQTCNTTAIEASTPTVDFTDNGDGTVTHNKTGLMWKKCAEGLSGSTCTTGTAQTYTWEGALNQAKTVNTAGFAGYNDWRLPNIKELSSIVERQCQIPPINATIFPATPSDGAGWSSSPSAYNISSAWYVNSRYGDIGTDSKNILHYVRLVRGGQ